MEWRRQGNAYGANTRSHKDEALKRLASIDLIELCNEAKVEHCRATRDLRSCGRFVQHVLNSCGHASLCVECSQRCDLCPICRIPIPKNGSRLRLRLYNECIEAGLMSKRYDDRFQEKEDDGKQLMADVQRLYSLFDVAIENNMVSLVCHYVTDVCMDESAVSSDPVLAFLLDEVVVKDWCKQTFRNIIADLCGIYTLGVEEMKMKLGLLHKFVMQLTSISSVIEVLESAFKGTLSPQLQDLHHLSENILKAKQHLEVMIWCIRHQFLENVQSRHRNFTSWRSLVRERKSATAKRSWPDFTTNSAESAGQDGSTLFIEDALSNLGIEQEDGKGVGEELEVTCLQKGGAYPTLFRSKIEGSQGCYPFENLRAAIDILFLHGSSDLVIAKRAIFLYYLFDRHWTMPDKQWRHLIDDFASAFGITRHSLLESFTFYLLDDETEQALQEACRLLPEIACPATHPKIAQILLERQKPDAALMILRCSGRDGLCAYANSENGGAELVSLSEAVTAVRVRVECGLLTEAFMYQRIHCSKVKEEKWKHKSSWAFSNSLKIGSDAWMDQMEVLVTEICYLCIRRNLVDRMIELPWNSDEEKYLHKCLFDTACEDPSTTSGSLLVVFYLQRYRYIEAYQVHRKLQSLEQDFASKTTSEEVASMIRSTSQWRAGLVDKGIELLPEVLQQQVKTGSLSDFGHLSAKELELPAKADFSGIQQQQLRQPSATSLPSASLNSSLVLGADLTPFPSKKTSSPDTNARLRGPVSISRFELGNYRAPSILHGRLLTSLGGPSTPNRMDSPGVDRFAYNVQQRDKSTSNHNFVRDPKHQVGIRQDFQSDDDPVISGSILFGSQTTPLKELNRNASRALVNNRLDEADKVSSGMEPNGSPNQVENAQPTPYIRQPTADDHDDLASTPGSSRFSKHFTRDPNPTLFEKRVPLAKPWTAGSSEEPMDYTWSGVIGKRDSPVEEMNMNGGLRWRSDGTSEDEEDSYPEGMISGAPVATPARVARRSRFRRR
ncbi:E3 ubiquitin-protein ligase HOS1 [Magnolia sinica]|uniref:E3 ubiquitin-protein ligase HOS1 n=1 Tax=Magnolia sinica TaxID=86752 RepID=UPI00265B37B6|nr:E3 ubiquitin-protein ligase HOS1 [Magnolia sinica]